MDLGHLAVRLAAVGRECADLPATRIKDGDGWRTATYGELWTDARRIAAFLMRSGVKPGDRVAIFAPNVPEWTAADLGILTAGAVVVPVYSTSGTAEVRHILSDSGCVAIFIGSQELADVVPFDELPGLRLAVVLTSLATPSAQPHEGTRGLSPQAPVGSEARISTTRSARSQTRVRGRSLQSAVSVSSADENMSVLAELPAPTLAEQEAIDRRLSEASGEELASLVYTSGTTGIPKGVMLTHRGFTFQIDGLNQFFQPTSDDHSLCFLPLSHALERGWTFFVLANGCLNTYWPDPRTVADGLVAVEPTMLVSVPRLYEKVYAVARQRVRKSAVKRAIFSWALKVGRSAQTSYEADKSPSRWVRAQLSLADRLVYRSIRTAIGGPKTVLACGGAPLRKDVQEFFSACGVQLLPGYGLTEASPLVSFNAPSGSKIGSAGRVVPGGEIRISDDGEVCYRGPNVMAGYWGMPEETQRVLRDGWLHTGDVGHLDRDDFLAITDRIKDLIVTSNGKNIAPAPIEGLVLSDPLFEYAMLLGDNRPYVTLLVSPSLPALEDLGHQLQITWAKAEELVGHPQILAELKHRVARLTAKLAHHEQIKDMRVVRDEFSQENGLLTPTLKVKRKETEVRFRALIEDMYSKIDGRKR